MHSSTHRPGAAGCGDSCIPTVRYSTQSADAEADPELAAALEEGRERFRLAFEQLRQREREVVVLLYVQDLTLREVGEILEVSESRVCQIHTQVKRKLRVILANERASLGLAWAPGAS